MELQIANMTRKYDNMWNEWENNCHGVKNAESKVCELDVVTQKLIPHCFFPHSFIAYYPS